jgi:hypothetical protein
MSRVDMHAASSYSSAMFAHSLTFFEVVDMHIAPALQSPSTIVLYQIIKSLVLTRQAEASLRRCHSACRRTHYIVIRV